MSLGTNVVAPDDTNAGDAGSQGEASSGGAQSQGGESALPDAGAGGRGGSGGQSMVGAGGEGLPPLPSGGTSHGGAGGSAGSSVAAGGEPSGGGLAGTGASGGATGFGGAGGIPLVGDMLPYWICSRPAEAASCEAQQPGLYFAFNRDDMKCEQVSASCSDPFSNLFATEEDCVNTCATYSDVGAIGPVVEFTSEGDPAACMVPPLPPLPPLPPGCMEGSGKRYYFDPRTFECLEQECLPDNPNAFPTWSECAAACLPRGVTDCPDCATAVVEASSCAGFGEQISDSTSGDSFVFDGRLLWRDFDHGCGCRSRAEFVLVYEPQSPLLLRLCQDRFASICQQTCRDTLRWDLANAFARSGTSEFVFVD